MPKNTLKVEAEKIRWIGLLETKLFWRLIYSRAKLNPFLGAAINQVGPMTRHLNVEVNPVKAHGYLRIYNIVFCTTN